MTYVTFDEMCDNIESCGGSENRICHLSRSNEVNVGALIHFNDQRMFPYCLKGLEELHNLDEKCFNKLYKSVDSFPIPIQNSNVLLTLNKDLDCRFLFGEMYVYMACIGACLNKAPCPLKHIPHDSCINKHNDRYLSVTNSNQLSVLLKRNGQYHNEFFVCDNKICIDYTKVCDLKDDCGDGSDEKSCTNHFKCSISEEIIPLTSFCDRSYNCKDLSDECGHGCDKNKYLMNSGLHLLIICFVVGILALLLNLFNLIDGALSKKNTNKLGGIMNFIMINLISIGDLLMGIYLILVGAANIYYGDNYCYQQFRWLSSSMCAILGSLSTVASQLSLLAMTTLSIFRVSSVDQLIQPSASSRKSRIIILTSFLVTVLSSLTIGLLPLIPQLEDYFVNGLHYDGIPLLMGSVNKARHAEILGNYHKRNNFSDDLTWKSYRYLTAEMFSSEYGGKFLPKNNHLLILF